MNTISSSQVTVPSNLSKYISNTKIDSRKLDSAIKSLYSETDEKKLTKATEKFVKYYNSIIKDNSIYNDEGLKKLTKTMEDIVNGKSSSLSSLGITIENSGKLKIDNAALETAISNNNFSEFVSNNKDSGGLFYDIKKLVAKLKKDDTYYLSNASKQIISNATVDSSTVDTYA